MRFNQRVEQRLRLRGGDGLIGGRAKKLDRADDEGALHDLVHCDGQPFLHLRALRDVRREPCVRRVVLGRDVGHDRGRIAEDEVAVRQHRHLTQRVQLQEVWRLVRPGLQVDEHVFIVDAKDAEQRLNAVGVAGKGVAIELHLQVLLLVDFASYEIAIG